MTTKHMELHIESFVVDKSGWWIYKLSNQCHGKNQYLSAKLISIEKLLNLEGYISTFGKH